MRKIYVLIILSVFSIYAEILVSDDFESGTGNWTLTGNWGLESGGAVSGSYSLTESPAGNYSADEVSSAVWTSPINLSGYETAGITFQRKYMIEDGFDYMYFEVSTDNGSTWNRLKSWTGSSDPWVEESVSLHSVIGYEQVKFRFLFQSDESANSNGMNIDDLYLYTVPESHDTFLFHSGPEFYEASLDEYESSFECYDLDGIDSAWVEYMTDGYLFDSPDAINTFDNFFNFTIPVQDPGTVVEYRICIMDGSEEHNVLRTGYFTYISGDYKKYDSGVASYYKDVQEGQAMAVKVTLTFTGMYSQLVYALIRNYDDGSDSLGDMKFHVWNDQGGSPGYDMIEPFVVLPEAVGSVCNTTFTKIDMRDKGFFTKNDFWIAISGNNMRALALVEAPYEEGTIAYERSYSGTWNGSDWDWVQEPEYNYQFRAILSGALFGIEAASVPSSTELYQNYPNPFNPSTEIGYSLKSEGFVTLSVFNTKGELVSTLVNGKKTAGNHSVNFNGEGLNSGIYFYKLSVDGKAVQSRKMMMLK